MAEKASFERFEASQEVTNWTMPQPHPPTMEDGELLQDYNTGYWALYSSSPSPFHNGSYNGSIDDNNNGSSSPSSVFKRDEDLAKVEMAVLALIFILTVLGNCIVLLGIFFRRQKMTRMYYFILHLSVADLITAFFNVLTQLFWEITYRFQGGNFLCKFVKYTQILGPYSSSYVLVMTAMDRYQAICYPLSNCTWTARRSKTMLGIAWSISLLFSLPQVFIFSYQMMKPATETEPAEYDCWGTFSENGAKIYVTWYSITVFIIPLVILVFAYSCITRAIWINFNMKAASRNQDNYEKKMTRQDSDDGEGPSQYEHSVDESTYHQTNNHHHHGNNSSNKHSTSRSVFRGKKKSKLSINLFNPSKRFMSKRPSTSSSTSTSGGGGIAGGNDAAIEEGNFSLNRMNVNDMKALEEKSVVGGGSVVIKIENKNSRYGGGGGSDTTAAVNNVDDEELHLIPKSFEKGRNELRAAAPTASRTSACHPSSSLSPSPDKSDDDRGMYDGGSRRNGNIVQKYSPGEDEGNSSTLCQHGCFRNRCNFCLSSSSSSSQKNDRRHSTTAAGSSIEKRDGRINKGNSRSFRFSNSNRNLLLPNNKNRLSRRGSKPGGMMSSGGGGGAGQNSHKSPTAMATYVEQQPRTHSVKGISRAKIKTIKLTVTIICCYIFCSSPFIAAQLWSVYDPNAYNSTFFTGPTFTILTLLASLNSCVNPFIFLFFNSNLLENCFRGIFRPKFPARRFNQNGSPLSRTLSQNKKAQLSVGGVATNSTSSAALTSLTKYGVGPGPVLRGQGGTRAPPPAQSRSQMQNNSNSNATTTSSILSHSQPPPSPLHNPRKETQVPSSVVVASFTNGSGPPKGYMEQTQQKQKESGTGHKINAVELDLPSSPMITCKNNISNGSAPAHAVVLALPLNSSHLSEKYSSENGAAALQQQSLPQHQNHHQQQPSCGVETVLVGNNKSHHNHHHHRVGNSTLIT